MTKRSNNQRDIAENEQLRCRLDDLYACVEDALSRLYTDDGYVEMCNALCFEFDHLNELLKELDNKYQKELPLSAEEPKDVVWDDEKDKIAGYAELFEKKDSDNKSKVVTALYNRMMESCELLGKIDDTLFPELCPEKFASYSKREMNRYNMYKWNKALRTMRNISPTTAHIEESMQHKLDEYRNDLHSMSEYIISADNKIVYHEGLGRHLWQQRHSKDKVTDIDDTLFVVRCVEHYSRQQKFEFAYLDSEPIKSKPEPNIGNVKMRFGFCHDYFAKGYDEAFVEEMLRDLLKRKDLYELLCDKLSNRKRQKFVFQIAGVFLRKGVFENCDREKLAIKILNDNRESIFGNTCTSNEQVKPSKQSRIDYINHMIDDVPKLQDAIELYIEMHPRART